MKMMSMLRPLLLLLLVAAPAAAQDERERTAEERARTEQARRRAAADRARTGLARAGQGVLREEAERRAFDLLLRHRQQLALSDQQVHRLEEIRGRLEQQNAPLRARLVEEHQRWQAARRAQLERMSAEERRQELRRVREGNGAHLPESLQTTVRQMRLHINEAMHQAQGVLTAEQRLRARELLARQAAAARPRVQPGRRAPRHQLERRERVRERVSPDEHRDERRP
jgi:Skp family chaperone for outer membrane proteins